MGHVTITTPLSGTCCHWWDGTIYNQELSDVDSDMERSVSGYMFDEHIVYGDEEIVEYMQNCVNHKVRTDIGTDSGPYPVHCVLN